MATEIVDVLLRARMEASGVEAGVGQIQKSLKGLTLPKGISDELEKSFSKLTPLLKDYQKQLNKGFSNKKDLQNFNALKEKISETFSEIRSQVQSVNSQEVRLKVDTQEIDKLENKIVAKTADLQKALNNVFTKSVNTKNITEEFDKVINNATKAKTIKPMVDAAKAMFNNQDYASYNNKIDELKNKILSLKTTKIDLATTLGVKNAEKNLDAVNKKVEKFFDDLKVNAGKVETIEHLKQELQELGVDLEKIKFDSLTNGANELNGIDSLIDSLASSLRDTGNAAGDAGQGMVRMVDEVNELKTSTQYFFSLRNMINLLKRGIDEAVQSVKDLDKAMTDTAVVTDYRVSDLWNMLPQYTKIANQLGATTQGAYETMTLYYQQGLDQQQAFALGAETMKMARIAGLEYAETTDMMTAALRGFNMELNEVSAKRVNDVYSELAAITASDTEELGTAMQRTASIAHSAGMSFEGTTAFLAQAIETTREPAENIGTAMKTIVARFQEMKKNPLEITEVDGEEVSYNKVDQALQSIGVSLKDTNGQFRELDQVFLDISSRWDSLTQTQQRYIATTAAGSRQQSRFIAMMDNYDRTMQLMEAANNSAGASDEQFGKTMDSLEAKVNKLHNAWQQFTMGIMNNNMVKGFVDAGTTVLTIVNKIIDVLSFNGQSGLIKSLLSLTTAFTALKGGGKIINSLIGGLGGLVDPQSSFKEGLKGGFLGGRSQLQADRISNPIVKAIYSLIPVIKGVESSSQASKYRGPGDYNAARKDLKTSGFLRKGNRISLKNVSDIFDSHQLNKEQQAAFLKASPGLRSMLSKQLGKIYEQAGASSETRRGMVAGFKKGAITLKDALAHEDLHESFSDMMSRAEKSGSESQMAKAAAIKDKYSKQFQQEAIEKGVDVNDYLRKSFADLKVPKEGIEELMAALNERSPMERFQDGLGQIGAGLMSAGSTLQMFGATLSETNPILGQFVSGLGSTLTTMGSLVNTIPALMNPWTIAIGAIGAAIALEQKRVSDIKKSAEEVSESFKEANKTTQENISSLKSYRSELATLSQGVDINGNNINLSDAEYERYLEIVDEIATINPKIVQGYNAQGHAIIDNNRALEETLKLQEQNQKKALNNYIDPDSLQKLINARNINKDYITGTAYKTQAKGTFVGGESSVITTNTKAPMANAVRDLVKEFDKQKGLDVNSILQGYGISLEQLQAGEEKAVNTFVKNQDQINAQVGAAIATSGEEINESLTNSFDKLSEQTANFDAAIEPVLQNLQTYVSNTPAFKNIGPEFQSALMSGLKDIVIQPDLDAKGMQEQARLLIQEFDNLSAEGSDYANAMKQVEEAQNNFAESLDAEEYAKGTEKALQTLDHLMSQYAGKTDSYSQAIAEYLQNQMDRIRDFTEDSGVSLSQAMNGVADTIAAAEGAFGSFQESTKTDLATGKDSMKSIFDEVTKETDGVALHMEKFGDGTFWKGARALLGDEFVEKNAENIDVIKKELRSLEPELKAGEEGFAAFWNSFSQVDDSKIEGFKWNEDGSYDIDRNVNPDVYEQIANAMHRSEEYVVAMLNAGKQFADIDFHQVEDVRKALSTDEAAIKNDGKIFVKSDYYENALDEAKIYNPNERKNIKAQDEAAGIIEIKDPDKITKKDFQSMGISDLPNLIKTFGDTGQFNRDEIAQYAEALGNSGLIDYNPEDFGAEYQHYLDSQEHPELQPIESIESTVQRIASLIDRNNVLEGNYSKEDEDTAQALYDSVIGKAGTDTATQYFGEGKNEAGNRLLSPKEFVDTYANLGKIAADAEEKANTYYKGAEAAEAKGDTETADKLTKIGDLYDAVQKSSLANQQEGKQAWVDEYARQAYESKLQELENSGLDDAAIKAEAAKVWQEAFDAAQATVNTAEGKEDTNQEIHQAVQEQAQALSQSNASNEQIKTSMIEAANKMAEAQMKPGEIASELNKAYGTNLTDKDVNIGKNGVDLTLDESKLQEQLSNLHADVEANITGISMGGHAAMASGQNNPNSIFHRHGTMARGSRHGYIISGRPTLTGEEGEELVWEPKRNEAYMVGSNGPQFANISKDAVVWNAAQTKRIKRNSKVGSFGTGAKGISNFGTMAGGTGGTGGLKIPGILDVDAMATIQDVTPPEQEPIIPVKADLQVEGNTGGLLSKLFGNKGPSIDVTANIISTNTTTPQTISVIGNIIQLNNQATIDNINATATVTQVTKSGQVAGEPIKVQATATTTKVENKVKNEKVSAGTQTLNVTANTAAAQAKINQLISLFNKTYTLKYKASGPSSISVPVSANFIGSWKKTVTINKGSGAKGVNNYIAHHSMPTFNSAAGGYGQLGPKGRGGLTLTGEKGFEIAWLPSENRSMILGVAGPQMLDLPSDAVIYTHEQSKKILKRKSISAGSMDRGSYTSSDFGGGSSKSKKKTSKGSGSSSNSSKSSNSSVKENLFSIEEVVRFNIDQKVAKVTAEIANRTKNIEKTLGKIGTTYNQIVASTKEQVTALQGVKDYNAQLLASYQRQLADYRSKQTVVSYTDNAGKSQEQKINIASYLNADGTANVSAIRAAGSSAIQEAIYKEINSAKSLVDGINNAQKAIKDAEDQMAELGKKISETFYQWENELTEVYDLTQRIASATSFTDRFTSQIELELSKLNVGFGETAQAIENTRIVLTRSNLTIQEQIKNQQQMINARQRELEAALSYEDEKNKLEKFIRQTNVDDATKAANIEWAQNLLSGAQLGSKYIKDVFKDLDGSIQYTIDWEQFNADNEANPYSKDTYEAIKKYLEDVNNAATEFNNSIKDQTDFIKQTYDALKEYQSFVADMEDTLIQNYEKQIQTTIDNAKQLSESISNSLKNLLDEVKRKLDERRKQEDNAKTEQDISQKQQRLAALRANTAGGNQVEIAKLEKEIADAQQSYGRTLEDQLIDRLQQQGDEAAQQRERQIELAEAANEISAASHKELIDLWLKDPETYKEEIKAAWLEAQEYDEKGEAGQYVLNQGFESQFTQLITAVEQSGFNNLEAPFTAIEGNTNTLVSLLQQLTQEQIGISDESSKAFGSVADVTYRNTGTFKNGSNSTSNMGGMTLVSSNPKRANSGITLGKDSYVKKNAEYDESGNIKSYGQVVDSNTGITYDFAYDKNTGKNIYLDTGEISGKNSLGGLNMNKSEDAIYVGQIFDVASQGAGQNQKYFVKSITPVKGKNGYTVTYEYTSRGGGKYRWSDSFYGDQLTFSDNTLSGVSDYVNSRQILDVLNPADNKWYLLYKTLGGMNANEKDATYAVAGTGDANRLSKYSVSLNDLEWVSDETGNYFKFKKWVGVGQKFKTGGLNTFTGPAWLDGTPSKPELVLNAKDTQNFLALRDVLSNVMRSASTLSNSYGGDIMYDINIHVDKIEKDYDVDRVVDKVKKEITKGAGYRNVTQVRNFR